MKKLILMIMLTLSTLTLVGCGEEVTPTGSEKDINKQQKQMLEESNRQTGMPNIKHNFEKKMAKDIWELRDNPDLTTYAYTQNMDGQYVYLGRCVGYGLPYTTQYTSPEVFVDEDFDLGDGWGGVVLPQADPNGLYSSETTNATWLMLINEDTNEREIIYSEPSIVVTQSKLPKRLVANWSLPYNY